MAISSEDAGRPTRQPVRRQGCPSICGVRPAQPIRPTCVGCGGRRSHRETVASSTTISRPVHDGRECPSAPSHTDNTTLGPSDVRPHSGGSSLCRQRRDRPAFTEQLGGGRVESDHAHPDITSATTVPTSIAVVDLTTGSQVGTAVTVSGRPQSLLDRGDLIGLVPLTDDGSRVLAMRIVPDPLTTFADARVTLVDTGIGAQIENTVVGYPYGSPALSADKSIAIIVTGVGTPEFETGKTRVTLIDTATGAESATTLAGFPLAPPVLTADRTRAAVITTTFGVSVVRMDGPTGLRAGAKQL